MYPNKLTLSGLTLVAGVALTACGGGGGDAVTAGTGTSGGGPVTPIAPVASTLSFPLRQAITTANTNGGTFTLHANGTAATELADGLCSGTFTQTDSPAIAAAVNDHNAPLASTATGTTTYTNCTPNSTQSATSYFDSSYNIIGYGAAGGAYRVYSVLNIPAAVMVGDGGAMGTETFYSDRTKLVTRGHRDISYSIEADTANSVIVNRISKYYYPDSYNFVNNVVIGDVLQSTVQTKYRLSSAGSFTTVSIDTQNLTVRSTFGTSTQNHFLWR
jgi:hypothetical protein